MKFTKKISCYRIFKKWDRFPNSKSVFINFEQKEQKAVYFYEVKSFEIKAKMVIYKKRSRIDQNLGGTSAIVTKLLLEEIGPFFALKNGLHGNFYCGIASVVM